MYIIWSVRYIKFFHTQLQRRASVFCQSLCFLTKGDSRTNWMNNRKKHHIVSFSVCQVTGLVSNLHYKAILWTFCSGRYRNCLVYVMKLIAIQSPVAILYCALQRNSALALFWVSNNLTVYGNIQVLWLPRLIRNKRMHTSACILFNMVLTTAARLFPYARLTYNTSTQEK
jgi:hypothetical protein